jgi:hypothetical protein
MAEQHYRVEIKTEGWRTISKKKERKCYTFTINTQAFFFRNCKDRRKLL